MLDIVAAAEDIVGYCWILLLLMRIIRFCMLGESVFGA